MFTLREDDIAGRFRVAHLIKEGAYNSTYRVEASGGGSFFMKLYDPALVPARLMTDEGVMEIAGCRKLRHENVVSYVEDGVLERDGVEYPYLVTEFFHGRLLSEYLREGARFTPDSARAIVGGILDGLAHIHAREMNHNDITPRNIILDAAGPDRYIPRIIDLGHMCAYVSGSPPFPVTDLNLLYCSPEQLVGNFKAKGDVFAAAAVLYTLIAGVAPWAVELDETAPYADRKMKVREARRQPLNTALLRQGGADDKLVDLLLCALELSDKDRISLDDFRSGVVGKKAFTPKPSAPEVPRQDNARPAKKEDPAAVSVSFSQSKGGGGFADVAGMEELKADLTRRVIWILKDREKAEKYRLTPPNGMVLYGPPGCGKTFFARKFAEESGFKFSMVNGSDLGSIYIHGTQGKIAELFKQARAEAPSILCFDEFDAFVPSRGSADAEHKADEVNEFLAQLNNCAADGVFVIGTTNRLDMIDPAVLRKGRMDLHVEVPAPDAETRRKIFEIHLKGRPLSDDIDAAVLAEKTDGYASSDIAFIVNEAAMMAALADALISQEHLLHSIAGNRSSLAPAETRRKIGY